jgi:hypothetical protein
MLPFFKKIKDRYSVVLHEHGFILSVIGSIAFLLAALVFNYFAALYAVDRASASVADIILSNIPVFDVDGIFVYGPIIFGLIIAYISLCKPGTLPFLIKSIALFVVIRSAFIMLTHIGPFPDHIVMGGNAMYFLHEISTNPNFFLFSTGADLFFSGHTGLPFLLSLVFWKDRLTSVFCLIASIFFGVIVLLGHLHYSIDVASAFFITYTIYIIATRFFPKDHEKLLAAL